MINHDIRYIGVPRFQMVSERFRHVPEHVAVEWTERNPAQVGSLLNCINMELGKPRAIDVLKMPLGRRTMMKLILKVTELEDVRGILKPCEIETYQNYSNRMLIWPSFAGLKVDGQLGRWR